MIQCVWLDLTMADRKNGAHEYVIVRMDIDLNDYDDEEKETYVDTYGYTLNHLRWAYGDEETVNSIVAECILEESILNDAYVIDVTDSFEDAKEKIEMIIKEEK